MRSGVGPSARASRRGPARCASARHGLVALGLAAALVAFGCGPRYARTPLVEKRDLRVTLRAQLEEGEPVERGFDHPVTVSSVRVANILSRIDVREGEERRAAVADELLFPVSREVASALGEAGSAEEVVVRAIRRERRLGIFTEERLTSFVCWVKDGRLEVHLALVDDPLPRGKESELPEPWAGREAMDFHVVAGRGLERAGPQAVSASWRSEVFGDLSTVRRGPRGEVKRREVLMESSPGSFDAPEATPPPPGEAEEALPEDLSPEALRALAELEEARRSGEVTEAEYRARRREILER